MGELEQKRVRNHPFLLPVYGSGTFYIVFYLIHDFFERLHV